MKQPVGPPRYSPSDLVRYLVPPVASWMERYDLEHPTAVTPDEATEDERLIAQTGEEHERVMLEDFVASSTVIEIPKLSAPRSSELLVPHVSPFTFHLRNR